MFSTSYYDNSFSKTTTDSYLNPFVSSDKEKNNGLYYVSNNLGKFFNNFSVSKKNFFENFKDETLNNEESYPKTEKEKLDQFNKEFSNFDIFNEVKNENNKKISYCKFFLNNKCLNKHCTYFHGYNNNLKNITKIFGTNKENVTKIILTSKDSFIVSTKYSIKFYTLKEVFKCEKQILINQLEKKINEIRNIFCFEQIIFTCEFNTYNQTMSVVMRYENHDKEMQQLTSYSGNKTIGEIIYLKNESLILCFGNIYLEMLRTDVAHKKIDVVKKFQTQSGYGFSSVILFNQEFICGLMNGYIGILVPNKEGSQVFTKRFESKFHSDEITKLLFLEIDPQTHYFISGSSDCFIKLYNYEKDFSLIFQKDLKCPINNLFFSRDNNKNIMTMVSLFSGLIKVLDDKFNEIFDIRGPENQNVPRFGIDVYLDKDINIDENDNDSDNDNGNYLILNFGAGIEINKWIKER
jgi:hypothetical protein